MKMLDLLARPGVGVSLLWLKTLTVVLVVIFYWVYDSTLLAAYGIGPEMNVRGVFESKLVITWLSVHALKPLVWVLVAIFVALTIAGVAHDILKKRRYRKVQWSRPMPAAAATLSARSMPSLGGIRIFRCALNGHPYTTIESCVENCGKCSVRRSRQYDQKLGKLICLM